ncbi:hypothetical protein E5676_scaffold436G001130 [Cucumis melo var. makuwa]|uniref:Uncharacterized protein n=1 Tax=Cucumis melo var. makuwa TaxID=1194695 RepID=A0A5D3DQD9_CUCMM|nr:hypothetical protein E5676_scaffold436G001130 [Cucumis melo var. makuwa]
MPNLKDPLTDQGDYPFPDLLEYSLCDPLAFIDDAFKESEDVAQTPVASSNKETLENVIDDLLLKRKQIASEDAGKTFQHSSPKQTPKATTQNTK